MCFIEAETSPGISKKNPFNLNKWILIYLKAEPILSENKTKNQLALL